MKNNRLVLLILIPVLFILIFIIVTSMRGSSVPAAPLTEAAPTAAAAAPTFTPSRPQPELALTSTPHPLLPELAFPIRAAFYFATYPQDWQGSPTPFSHYQPTLGFYSSDDSQIVRQHIAAMQYGNIQAGIVPWWGLKHLTNQRIPALLAEGEQAGFRWSLFIQSEGAGNPPADNIQSDLEYIHDNFASSPAYLRIGGRFVVFVSGDKDDNCEVTDRWTQANRVNAYLVQKVFPGYKACLNQPDAWYQYSPELAERPVGVTSFSISPGYWKAGEPAPGLDRSLERWKEDIRAMLAAHTQFQLITTFNGWGAGTAVESAVEWQSPSGFGLYLDALHNNGAPAGPAPTSDLPLPATIKPQITTEPVIPPPRDSPPQSAAHEFTLLGAGDVTNCGKKGALSTAALIEQYPGAQVFTAGDNAQDVGAAREYQDCFEQTWGRFKDSIRPAPGNHDYNYPGAENYYAYFGEAAGPSGLGYYSYDLGEWHIVALNSNCEAVGGCGLDSPQELWLRSDLETHANLCTLAYWHHPRFSSGEHGNQEQVGAFWHDLYAAGAELVIGGHDHDYERFAPQDPSGQLDGQSGIRQFVVGTGGGGRFRDVSHPPEANSQVTLTGTYGVLKLDLLPGAYGWSFLPAGGGPPLDSGSTQCH